MIAPGIGAAGGVSDLVTSAKQGARPAECHPSFASKVVRRLLDYTRRIHQQRNPSTSTTKILKTSDHNDAFILPTPQHLDPTPPTLQRGGPVDPAVMKPPPRGHGQTAPALLPDLSTTAVMHLPICSLIL